MLSFLKTLCITHGTQVCLFLTFGICGCASPETWKETVAHDTSQIDAVSWQVDNPQPAVSQEAWEQAPATTRTLRDRESIEYEDVTLQSILATAMEQSEVLRELGGTLLRNPNGIRSSYLTGLQETDPRFGSEAALSAFDARFDVDAFFNNTDRIFNNAFFAGGVNAFRQDEHDYLMQLSKPTATGAVFALRNVTNYDANNAPGNTFNSAWDTFVEGEVRQPLLQGGGLQFNRIAGPGSVPGVYNGVLIARVGSDITQTEFEIGVRDYVSNVINTYWDLYFAYRDLDARTEAMNAALETWNARMAEAEADNAQGGAEASDESTSPAEALAREQYYQFKSEVDEALSGRLLQGTQNRNGSTGGTLRGTGGVLTAERRLRLLIGRKINSDPLLRPSDEPELHRESFDWESARMESLTRRPELRQQQLRIRQSEMELLASRNFINPRLDAVAKYRWRGFGRDLIQYDGQNGGGRPDSAFGNLVTGNQQEWQVGMELSVPVGYRQAHAAVANAELQLARERSIYREQQREVVHDLSNAISDVDRAWEACENNLNRFLAADQLLKVLTKRRELNQANFVEVEVDRILDAQRRKAEAEIRYFRARAEYAVALKNAHFEKGSLMAYSSLPFYDGAVGLNQMIGGAGGAEEGSALDDQPASDGSDGTKPGPKTTVKPDYEPKIEGPPLPAPKPAAADAKPPRDGDPFKPNPADSKKKPEPPKKTLPEAPAPAPDAPALPDPAPAATSIREPAGVAPPLPARIAE